MHNDRSVAAGASTPALVAAAVFALALPGAAPAQEVSHGVTLLLPPSYRKAGDSGVVSPAEATPPARDGVSSSADRVIVVTAAPPPVPGWERPPEIEVIGLENAAEVIVYSPAPEPMPGWRKLQGVDIRYHRIAEPPEPSRITTHSWQPGAPTRITYHDGRLDGTDGVPYARTGSAHAAQSWNPRGPRYVASRIRYHGWAWHGDRR